MKVKKSRWRKLVSLPAGEKILLLEALTLQTWVWGILKIVPFRMLPRLFSGTASAENSTSTEKLESVRNAVNRASGVIRLQNKCLVSSLTARCMLRRRNIPSRISIGVTRGSDGKIRSHAWINSGDFEVVEQLGNYRVLHSF